MKAIDKIKQLRSIIVENLIPLIDRDYYLLEVPYYTNIGDTLIWQGELDFLKQTPYKCLGMHSLETFSGKIREGALVLFQGGGNFGDLWTRHHDFKMQVITKYPKNKFIFFPQTVQFDQEINMHKCAKILDGLDVTICARDSHSYSILNKNFKNNILLVPDMAFCICGLNKYITNNRSIGLKSESTLKNLLLKRTDKEFKPSQLIDSLAKRNDFDVTDWLTMLPKRDIYTKISDKLKHIKIKKILDYYHNNYYKKHLIHSGVDLLMSHDKCYTTRLHAAILGALLGKEVYFFDNSYGKNSNFYKTWLYDCDNIHFLDEHEL